MGSQDMKAILMTLADGRRLGPAASQAAFDLIMEGQASAAQIGAFLMVLRVRGETVDEITAGARALRRRMTKIDAPAGAIDTCGTGGDAKGTFNISTMAAIVVAACGVPVAKHGNRALSSRSGSADLLAALGVNIEAPPELVSKALQSTHIGFLMAPRHHSAMRHVAEARRELGTRTIFNLLGPLANPAQARRQLLGVFAEQWLEPMAEVLGHLGCERAWVVHGADGLDELTTTGATRVAELKEGELRCFEVVPEEAGLARAKLADLAGGTPEENAAFATALLEGAPGPLRDIVLLNAAAALIVAERVATLEEGVARAAEAIDAGKAKQTLSELVRITNEGGEV
ncbi:MAG: anthranilate phosphoribosyltransferase [Alphaproteobacteria bacterium]|nr:anthranilate phosphoribosyltransferase [Pseudomonadota bacterium]